MSDTPETDANAHNIGSLEQPHYVVDVEIVQDLERRLKAAEAENAALREAILKMLNRLRQRGFNDDDPLFLDLNTIYYETRKE